MRSVSVTFIALGLLLVVGCSKQETFGAAIEGTDSVSIVEILKNPGSFEGKSVRVEGEIATECPSGCWFELKKDNGLLYVDIEPSGLAIPQRVGKNAVVEGVVEVEGQKIRLIGKGVEIK